MATDEEITNGLAEIFRDVFLFQDVLVVPELSAKDVVGWDSFKQIEIVVATEERWGIKLTTRDLDSLHCVGDLARIIADKAP